MALNDIKYPSCVEGIQILPGPEFFQGGLNFGYFYSGNNYDIYRTGAVKTIMPVDYAITPSAGNTDETSWFPVLEYANGYKLLMRIYNQSSPGYFFMEWKTVDENGNEDRQIDGYSGHGSFSRAGIEPVMLNMIKVILSTGYSVPSGQTEPLPDTAANNLMVKVFYGSLGDASVQLPMMNVPAFDTVTHCTWSSYDEMHYTFAWNFVSISDPDACNTYMSTHGDPIPSDYPFIVKEGLPNDYDPSRPGGGDGNYSDKSDPIDFPSLPTGGALGSGAIHAFEVDSTKLTTLFQKLWSTSVFDMSTWQKLVSSPLDCIISLHAIPFSPNTGGSREIWFGNFNTAVSANIVTSQYVEIDCGKVKLEKFFGSAMDYSPYTRVSIFCPGSGIHDLATEDVQGSTLHMKYYIDVLTGDCLIMLKCGQSVLYKFTGNFKMQIPITARDDNALGNTIKGTLGMIGGAVIGGAIGNAPGAIAGATLSAAASVAMHKETVSRSGEITSNTAIMDDFVPYLIIHRPQQSLAVNYNKFKGYPSNITATLSSLSGYTEVEPIHLEGINGATDTELQEIEKLLKNGVII